MSLWTWTNACTLFMIALVTKTASAFVKTKICRRSFLAGLALLSVAPKHHYEDGYVTVPRGEDEKFSLYYRVYNKGESKIPLVVLHGGPSLPSQYLYPIVDHMNRTILYYDQLGCGKSDEPKELDYYSISQSVDDLESLLKQLSLRRIHLLGHSYGGVVAYEYLRRYPARVTSLILANTVTDMNLARQEYGRLEKAKGRNKFWTTHACRVGMPDVLNDAMIHSGTVWTGMDVVSDYVAVPLANEDPPPTMILRTKYDFGDKASENWSDMIDPIEEQVYLVNCAHYPHLEDGATFGKIVGDFCNRHDSRWSGSEEA